MIRLALLAMLALPVAALAQDDTGILTLPLDQLPPDIYEQEAPNEDFGEGPITIDPFADEPRATIPDAAPQDPLAGSLEQPAPPEGRMLDAPKARLRGLDTLTNTVNDFEIGVGETLAFKRLIVTLEACRYPEGELTEEAYAFLEIRDRRESEDRFKGWMLASSPALSALDHPRYDIWVLSCKTE